MTPTMLLRSFADSLGARRVLLVTRDPGGERPSVRSAFASCADGSQRAARPGWEAVELFGPTGRPVFAPTPVAGVFEWDAQAAGGGHGLAVVIRVDGRFRGGLFAELPGRVEEVAGAARMAREFGAVAADDPSLLGPAPRVGEDV